MAIRNIRKKEDPILRKKCREVLKIDDHLLEILNDMAETM
jgi:peptide deformylase